MTEKSILLIGYSGHAFVVADALQMQGRKLFGYMDVKENALNPYKLDYLGSETGPNSESLLQNHLFITTIGDNLVRCKITESLLQAGYSTVSAIHPKAIIASSVTLGEMCMVLAGACINPVTTIGKGTIINTGAIVEHECSLGDYVHIAPGAVLAGNVKVGNNTFVGANAVIKQGTTIGNNVTIGAGTVVLHDIADNSTCVGNPAKILKKN